MSYGEFTERDARYIIDRAVTDERYDRERADERLERQIYEERDARRTGIDELRDFVQELREELGELKARIAQDDAGDRLAVAERPAQFEQE